jgi:hypothetical protein
LLVLLTSACHAGVNYGTGGALQVQGGSGLAVVIVGAALIATAVDGEPPTATFADLGTRPAPDMQPDRSINEQDCTKPIDFTSGNLRCR